MFVYLSVEKVRQRQRDGQTDINREWEVWGGGGGGGGGGGWIMLPRSCKCFARCPYDQLRESHRQTDRQSWACKGQREHSITLANTTDITTALQLGRAEVLIGGCWLVA